MLKRIYYNETVKILLRFILGFFYEKKYLTGRYFDEKRMGWIWAIKGINSKIFGDNRKIPWPVNSRTLSSNSENIEFHVDDLHIFQTPGCYWQNHDAMIRIGRGCHIAPNVGIITTNHDLYEISKHVKGEEISLGDFCWIGMNSVVLPGVKLGPHTIVAAGAVVTKSFEDGYCIIGGVPAKKIKDLDISSFIEKQV